MKGTKINAEKHTEILYLGKHIKRKNNLSNSDKINKLLKSLKTYEKDYIFIL